MSSNKNYANLAVFTKGRFTNKLFTYKVKNIHSTNVKPGSIVKVPFNNRIQNALVVNLLDKPNNINYRIKDIIEISYLADSRIIEYSKILSNFYINPLAHTITNYTYDYLNIKSIKIKKEKSVPNYFFNIDCRDTLIKNIDIDKINLIYCPSIKSINALSKYLKEYNIQIKYEQLTGGKDEKELVTNKINRSNSGVFLILNTLIYNPFFNKDKMLMHYWDTNNYKYLESRKPYFNLLDVANIQSQFFNHSQYFYSEFPNYKFVKSCINLVDPIPEIDTKYYYDNDIKNALLSFIRDKKDIDLKKTSFNFNYCSLEMKKNLQELVSDFSNINEYSESRKISDINVLIEPTISYKGVLNSESLAGLIRYLNILSLNSSKLYVITSKTAPVLRQLTAKNINKWAENEFKYRAKYGPNYEKKIVNITSKIPIKIHGLNLRGPIFEDSSSTYKYQFTYTIDDINDINYFDLLNKYNYSFINYF